MKEYQLWGFVYLGVNGINAITGNKEEADVEREIPCFDGISYFKFSDKYYIAYYPKFNNLTEEDKRKVAIYCGYIPEEGEYGVIMGALGKIEEVYRCEYLMVELMYPVKDEDKKLLF